MRVGSRRGPTRPHQLPHRYNSSSSQSPTSAPPPMNGKRPGNWVELPSDLTFSILLRLGAVEILEVAQKVCREWRRICKDPTMWRRIDMRDLGNRGSLDYDFESMCCNAIDRSQGGLVEINTGNVGTDSLLSYIADRSSNLKSLTISMYFSMTNTGLVNAVAKLPLLEELEVSHTWSKLSLKAIGHSCPKLKTLKLNCTDYRLASNEVDVDAMAIAESMPELRHLQLFGNRLTQTGLNAILDGCPHLEHLDLRKCSNINLFGDLEKRCFEKIKEFRGPDDSVYDRPFDICSVFRVKSCICF